MYYVILEDYDNAYARFSDRPPTIKRTFYQLLEGISLASQWPTEVVYKFADTNPDGLQLRDFPANDFQLLMVSPALKSALEALELDGVEYLPIQVHDHKGRVASNDYHIANLFPLVPAVDRDNSEFELSPLARPDGIFSFTKLVLKDNPDEPLPLLFRLKEQPMLILGHQSIVDSVKALGLTGMRFVTTPDFKTFAT